jgi:uncharacterized protein DUF429
MPDDVVFRLSPRGGPPPEAEIVFHAQRSQEYGHTWVGLRRPRNAERIHYGMSRVYLITSAARSRKTVLRGIVREVRGTRPNDELLGDIYRDHDFPTWWWLDSVECLTIEFDTLRLRMTDGRPYDTRGLSIRQPFNYLAQESAWPPDAPDSADVGMLDEVTDVVSDLVAPPLTKEEPELVVFRARTTGPAPRGTTIHAVDWSGGGEFTAPNAKIRYVRWDFATAGSSIKVLDPTVSRRDILRMIRAEPGLWIVDFPFGLPVELMRRADAQPNDLDATLAFTRDVRKEEFRDYCNAIWARSGERASKHRATERTVGCGWFDWFVQLFRQTWTGQVEIVGALRATASEVALLPWDHERAAATQLVEGFPGASLRDRGLAATGYKKDTDKGRGCRASIVAGLVTLGLPLSAAVQREAVDDREGDLIDALALLLAGLDALGEDHAAIRAGLDQRGLLGEGWIYR